MTTFEKFCKDLENKVKVAYEEHVTIERAEELAGEFLHAQFVVSAELRKADLDARMRKQNNKAVRGAIYLDAATKGEKKPTEAALAAIIETNDLVQGEQKAYDEAEVLSSDVERAYNICREAHIYFRGIAKGSMG
jgi:hypothetical protein